VDGDGLTERRILEAQQRILPIEGATCEKLEVMRACVDEMGDAIWWTGLAMGTERLWDS
jgi:hypothetical protein